jgi:hypothetical protein
MQSQAVRDGPENIGDFFPEAGTFLDIGTLIL